MFKRITTLAVLLSSTLLVGACANTVAGVGQDVENTVDATGNAVSDVAN